MISSASKLGFCSLFCSTASSITMFMIISYPCDRCVVTRKLDGVQGTFSESWVQIFQGSCIDQDTIHRVARGASGPTKLALFGEEDKNFQKAPFDAAVQLAFHPTILLSMSFILFSDVKFPQLCLLRESAGISQSPFYSIWCLGKSDGIQSHWTEMCHDQSSYQESGMDFEDKTFLIYGIWFV